MAGIYSNSGCRPDSRLTSGSLPLRPARAHPGRTSRDSSTTGSWRVIGVPGAAVVAGRTYWLVVAAAAACSGSGIGARSTA